MRTFHATYSTFIQFKIPSDIPLLSIYENNKAKFKTPWSWYSRWGTLNYFDASGDCHEIESDFESEEFHKYPDGIIELDDDSGYDSYSEADEIKDPTDCKTRKQLHNCTIKTLNDFCKKQNLKVGGYKTEAIDRVWHYLQGTVEDLYPEFVVPPPKQKCCAVDQRYNKRCKFVGSELHKDSGKYFCWSHIYDVVESIYENKLYENHPDRDTGYDSDSQWY